MSENMSTMELLETVENNIYSEINRRGFDDPKRKDLFEEAKACYTIRNGYEQTEQNRLSNYSKNETEARRVDVEEKKVKTDATKAGLSLFGTIFVAALGTFTGWSGYMMSSWLQKDNMLSKWGETLRSWSLRNKS